MGYLSPPQAEVAERQGGAHLEVVEDGLRAAEPAHGPEGHGGPELQVVQQGDPGAELRALEDGNQRAGARKAAEGQVVRDIRVRFWRSLPKHFNPLLGAFSATKRTGENRRRGHRLLAPSKIVVLLSPDPCTKFEAKRTKKRTPMFRKRHGLLPSISEPSKLIWQCALHWPMSDSVDPTRT